MIENKISSVLLFGWSIKSKWLILTFLAVSLVISSCSSPRNVRNGDVISKRNSNSGEKEHTSAKYILPDNEYENKENEVVMLSSDNQQDEAQSGNSAETESTGNQNHKKKILTLREQMKLYEDEQKSLKTKVGEMDDDIQSIKRTLDKIKITLTERKHESDDAVAGESDESPEPEPKSINNKKPKNIILSDESAATTKKQSAAKPSKTATPKKKNTLTIKPDNKPEKKSVQPQKNIAKVKHKKLHQEKQIQPQTPNSEPVELALKSFISKDYQKSISEFNTILTTAKDAETIAKSNYWLGESYFAMKQWDKAIPYFQKVLRIKNTAMHDNAQMMIAESLIRSGQIPEAKKAFKVFVDSYPQSEYLPRARKMLQQL